MLRKYKEEELLEDLLEILNYLGRFYVRRNIMLKPKSSNIRAKILEINRELSNEDILKANIYSTGTIHLNPLSASDEEFRIALHESIYNNSPQTARFVLIELEREYSSYFDKQTSDILDDKYEGKSYYR